MYRYSILSFIVLCFVLIASCKRSVELTDGVAAYNAKMYSVAAELLSRQITASKTQEERYNKTLMLARSYAENNEPEKAFSSFEKAISMKEDAVIMLEAAMQLKKAEKYEEAKALLNQIITTDKDLEPEATRQFNACNDAQRWIKDPGNTKVTPLHTLNSAASDFASYLMNDGTLIFTSSRNEAEGTREYSWTGEKFYDLYASNKSGELYSSPSKFDEQLNTEFHEGTACFSADKTEMYFTKCGSESPANDYCHIHKCVWEDGAWSVPEKLVLISDTSNEGQPFLSKDGKTLFFSSDDKGGFGGRDIYTANRVDNGWGNVSNIGSYFNTEMDEMYPTLDKDNNLYYSSNGLSGMGGLDIFFCARDKKKWSKPVNMQYPVNSGGDDFYIFFDKYKPNSIEDPIKKTAFISSSRPGSARDDLYRVEFFWKNEFVLHLYAFKRDQNVDGTWPEYVPAAFVNFHIRGLSGSSSQVCPGNDNGYCKSYLTEKSSYLVYADKKGYSNTDTISISTVGKKNPDKDIIVFMDTFYFEKAAPITTSKEIEISNIYYDYDKATLRPESFPPLDTLYTLFKEYPDLTIEIGSHTDSRGSDAYNQKLSQARAQSVVDYLVNKGLSKEKLIAKGYGETRILNECTNGVKCSEEQHQRNRRTTFRIVSSKLQIESK